MSDADELRWIAEQLHELADRQAAGEPRGSRRKTNADLIAFADPNALAELAQGIYRTRRLRDRHFNPQLFADPAWDILLDLFIQKSTGKRVAVTSACTGSGVPPTTALRWLSQLMEEGLIIREEDEIDRRRAFVRLSNLGDTAVRRVLVDSLQYLRAAHPRLPRVSTALFFKEDSER